MGKEYENTINIAVNAVRAHAKLSTSAQRVLHLYAQHAGRGGVTRISRDGTVRALELCLSVVERAVQELIDAGFLAQVGYSRMAVNPQMIWQGRRDRAEVCVRAVTYELHKQAYAATLAKKRAAGRESWRTRQVAKGVDHGVVEETGKGTKPPY